MSMRCYNLNRSSFWRRGCGVFFIFFLLVWVREAAAQNYLLRYGNTAAGAVTFTGNTLGLAKQTGQNQPGIYDSIGTFITLNTNSQVGTYPRGTTLNWTNNSSAAVLRIPTNSTILYAELIWGGSAQIAASITAAGNVLNYVNMPVQFILPNGSTNSVTPDPATASFVTNGTSAIFYVRSANVTALVQAAGQELIRRPGCRARCSPPRIITTPLVGRWRWFMATPRCTSGTFRFSSAARLP